MFSPFDSALSRNGSTGLTTYRRARGTNTLTSETLGANRPAIQILWVFHQSFTPPNADDPKPSGTSPINNTKRRENNFP